MCDENKDCCCNECTCDKEVEQEVKEVEQDETIGIATFASSELKRPLGGGTLRPPTA